jgi:nucleoside-diphosphate-sugar epimerase
MRILVTGHDGYIGAVMTPWLQAEGHEVVGLDSFYFEGCEFGDQPPALEAIRVDIRDVTQSHLAGFDAVTHLAGLSNDVLGDLDPALTFEINHRASVRLARLAKDAGVKRFLFSSSCSMYGTSDDDLLTEEAAFNPITPYAISKVRVEEDLSKLADGSFTPVYLRNATVYGVSPKLRADLVVNNLVGYAVTTGEVRLQSDGSPWRPLVHVDDVCRAFAAVLTAPREAVHNQAFNVARNEDNVQVREIAAIVEQVVPGSRITYAEGASPDTRCYRVDCSKLARTVPDAAPRRNLREGIEGLRDAFTAADVSLDQVLDRFVRIKRMKQLLDNEALDATLRWNATEPVATGGAG